MLSTSMYMYITCIYMCIQCMYITFGFIVWAPTRCTRADRAQTVDSNLSTIHAERIHICSAPANLKSICQNKSVYSCMYIMYTNTYTLHTMLVHVCNMYVLDHQRTGRACPLHKRYVPCTYIVLVCTMHIHCTMHIQCMCIV